MLIAFIESQTFYRQSLTITLIQIGRIFCILETMKVP